MGKTLKILPLVGYFRRAALVGHLSQLWGFQKNWKHLPDKLFRLFTITEYMTNDPLVVKNYWEKIN